MLFGHNHWPCIWLSYVLLKKKKPKSITLTLLTLLLSQDVKNIEENAAQDHGDDECDEDEYCVSNKLLFLESILVEIFMDLTKKS